MATDLAERPTSAPEPPPPGSPPTGRRRRPWVRALASYLVMVFALITLNFWLPRAMPGNPVDTLIAQGSDRFVFGPAAKAKLEEYYGLDRPLGAQYVHYLARLAHGDLGHSITTNQPVRHDLARAAPWTLLLIGSSMLLAVAFGVVAGVHTGWRRDRPLDRTVMTTLVAVREFPPYLFAALLLLAFSIKLGWFPTGGEKEAFSDVWTVSGLLDVGHRLVLPMLVLTAGLTAGFYLRMRAGMVSELGSDYLLLGRAKGLRPRRLKYRHAARNALLPVVSNVAIEMGYAVMANVLVERVFSYEGLGSMLVTAIGERDYPSLQGAFLALSLGIVTVNALADVANRRLDPRIAA